jgi:5-methylcytosine-specific restriction endonuclease McrA
VTPPPAPRRSPDPAPLAPGRYKLQVTLDEATRHKLKQLQDLLAHQIPNGDPAAIIERALDALLTQVQKRKAGLTDEPRARKAVVTRRTRAIPAVLRREVWTRDEGRCSFIGDDGHRCNETRCLEFGHLHPWGKRGEHSAANLALRCRAHNAFEAERDFGTSFVASKRKQRLLRKPLKVREPVARYVVHITT